MLESKSKSIKVELESSFIADRRKLPSHFDLDVMEATIELVSGMPDENSLKKLKRQYKYHRDGDLHIVHIPDPNSYIINPVTNTFYDFSDWLILFKVIDTGKFRNYYFLRTGTHEYLNISKDI